MATSGSYLTSKVVNSMTGDGCPDRANISWSASWNPATLQWTVAWSANGAGYYNNNYVTIFSGTVTVKDQNGTVIQTKSMAGQIAQARKDVQLIADSFTLGVDTYGNQSLQFSAVFRIGYNSATGESTGSQTFALDQVPLASYFTYAPSGVTVGSSGGVSTVNITRYNSSYTHDVTWTFGSYSHTETGVGTSASWTIPATWLNAIPSSATGTCTVTLVTKSGSTPVGQAATAQFTITANVVPSYTSIVYSYLGTAYSAGITNALIAGYSQMRIAVSGAAGAYGSSVARIEFIKGTSTMATVNTSAANYTYDTPVLTAAETTTFTVRITDTRGKYVQQTSQSFTIKAYAMPSFTAASAYRCNSSGTAQNDGTYVKVQATAVATPAENSIVSLTFAEKPTTSNTWSNEISIASYPITSGYANTSSYDVRIKATDKLGQTAYKYFTIPTAEYTMDFREGGKGVAFGKVAETDNLVDSAWDIKAPWFDGNWKYVREVNQADDLNTVIAFGKYAKYSNGSATKPSNCPTDSAFTLYIFSAQGSKEMNGAYKYGVQLIREFSNLNFYFRFMSTDGNGTLSFGSWTKYKMATADITRDTSTMSGVHLQKWEHVVQLSFRGTTINSSGSVGTLPSGYRPIGYMYSAGFYNGDTPAMLVIEADGTTKVYRFNGSSTVLATSGNFNGNVTFLVD